jgi:hypothetical protein
MKPTVFLRIASMLTLVHSALHTIGGVFGKPAPGIGAATEAAMRDNYFHVFGVTRSYWEFYRGMGLSVSIFLTAEALIFWLLATLAKKYAIELRPILWIFALAYLVFAVNSSIYFFSGPVIVEILIATCILGAIATAKPVAAPTSSSHAEARVGN